MTTIHTSFIPAVKRIITAGYPLSLMVFFSLGLYGQQTSTQRDAAKSDFAAQIELPVTMRQNVVSGKTPVGSKVEAKLTIGTLINGVVVPEGAILVGEVIDSVSKSGNDSSHLAIRMDSALWKNGTMVLKVYLTASYYPVTAPLLNHDSSDPTSIGGSGGWGAGSRYPGSGGRTSSPFPGPGNDTDKTTGISTAPSGSAASQHRVEMKDVESSVRTTDGAIILTSKHSDIKLDKATTYVFSAGKRNQRT